MAQVVIYFYFSEPNVYLNDSSQGLPLANAFGFNQQAFGRISFRYLIAPLGKINIVHLNMVVS